MSGPKFVIDRRQVYDPGWAVTSYNSAQTMEQALKKQNQAAKLGQLVYIHRWNPDLHLWDRLAD